MYVFQRPTVKLKLETLKHFYSVSEKRMKR